MSDLSHESDPMRILVVDEINGPADVLFATLEMLLEQNIAVNTVSNHLQALLELSTGCYDLAAIGLSGERLGGLSALVARIHARRPDLPVIAVGHHLDQPAQQRARRYGVGTVVNLPRRAAELRALAGQVARHYLF
ncbi:MAG: hypothetical protein JXB47_00695 [Anaerolineae bacterium]|nr:hypothetical protein [Anaerolineae bacterium]